MALSILIVHNVLNSQRKNNAKYLLNNRCFDMRTRRHSRIISSIRSLIIINFNDYDSHLASHSTRRDRVSRDNNTLD